MSDEEVNPWEDGERQQFRSIEEELRASIDKHWQSVKTANDDHFKRCSATFREDMQEKLLRFKSVIDDLFHQQKDLATSCELDELARALIAAGWCDPQAIWSKAAEILAAKPTVPE